ncbi:MAG: ATP-dependent RecD-like DNA helicase [Chlamydiae bacterium]|nr:ATP-dependent RecD-like DNA helicase [Chlamydiota bacterium]
MDQVFGYIERITYQNPENGYTVAQLLQPKKADLTCIVGIMPSLQPGESVRCHGQWKRHLVHGQQFEVSEYRVEAPADITGIRKYLGSGLIKGIGPVYAGRIVDKFGIDTLDIIDSAPEKLLDISGLGKKRLEKIKTCWNEQKSIREVMIFLQSNGVSPAYAQKIFKVYGNLSTKKVKENPFTLAKDIIGIGFKTADGIARNLGIAKNSPQRIESGIEYVLSELSKEGHVCFPIERFLVAAGEILEVDRKLIEERLNILKNEGVIILEELMHEGKLTDFIWNKPLYISERGIAKEIKRLLRGKTHLRAIDIDKALEWAQKKLNIDLGHNQKIAVANALTKKMQIITGGPGTGKSTITNAILSITEKLTNRIYLAAPTGRAAKRMTEITGKKAYTIHSLLEFDFRAGGFKRNRESPLDCDLIIIDEASMIDTLLMYSLLKAIPTHARAIFVGDINQLPSVGPGNVLKDIICSKCIPVTMLTEIFRQAEGSRIVKNAHLINNGNYPDIVNIPDSDFYFIEANDPEIALKQILVLVTQRIPKKFRCDPFDEIQVLAPMKRGILGTEHLNVVLQETLNPKENHLLRYGKKFAVDDKVMQIRNNYDRKVYNGDVGRIAKIDNIEQQVIVTFDNRNVIYDFSDLDEIILAYAVSIHKYQGSECPCVVIPIHTTHFKLLHRNLLYTGITRGKKLVVLVGMKKAIGIAVRNDEVRKRHTGLQQTILETHNPTPLGL